MDNNINNNQLELAQRQVLGEDVVRMQAGFAAACQMADTVEIQNNACAAFQAVVVVQMLRQALTDQVVEKAFMPLMNTSIGFRTDRDPNRPNKKGERPTPYDVNTVRDCIIDGVMMGLVPTGNQINIISGRCYPTKEGYTALLKKIGCKYIISVGQDQQKPDAAFAEIPCKINFDWKGDKGGFTIIATVKKDSYSSMDQLRGKAERRAKKSLYEYLTGCDFGDADEDSGSPAVAAPNTAGMISMPAQQAPQPAPAPQPAAQTQSQAMNSAAQQAEGSWRNAMGAQRQQQGQQADKPGF